MLELSGLISLIFYILIAGLIFGLLYWLIDFCKTPEPFNKVAKIIIAIVAVVILIGILMSFLGHPLRM